MVSNCACASPILRSIGNLSSSWRKRSSSPRTCGTASGGGGMKVASLQVQPPGPIQFWLRRSSPGVSRLPRPRASVARGSRDQPNRHRQFGQALQTVVHGINVVQYLAHVARPIRRENPCLCGRRSCANSAFPRSDLIGTRLFANIHENEQVRLGSVSTAPSAAQGHGSLPLKSPCSSPSNRTADRGQCCRTKAR